MKTPLVYAALWSALTWFLPVRAYEVFNVPPFTENGASASILKKNLKSATLVELDPFSVMVPKGWTFVAAGLSQKMSANLNASPTPSVDTDDTFFALNERKQPPPQTLDERFTKYKGEHPAWKVAFQTINKERWLVLEYEDFKRAKAKISHVNAFAIRDGKDYWMMMAAPASSKRNLGYLKQMMASVTFRAKVGGLLTPQRDSTDLRLGDTWRVVSYKMDDGPGLWTNDEARSLVGTNVTFKDNQVYFGTTSCSGVAK